MEGGEAEGGGGVVAGRGGCGGGVGRRSGTVGEARRSGRLSIFAPPNEPDTKVFTDPCRTGTGK